MSEPVITVDGLKKTYDRKHNVLTGVNLSICAGERVALIGSNGSGKSTLLKCIIGLHGISGGAVNTLGERFDSVPSPQQRLRLRRQTGFVFQNHCLVERSSVLTNVLHGMTGQPGGWRAIAHSLAPHSWRERAIHALDEVSLADRAMARADTLSGGQQQRVAIARALVHAPRLLIADEPAASLDPVAGRDVMELFERLCREHAITLLFTSHDMTHAEAFADRVIALKGGRVHFDQPAGSMSESDLEGTFNE